MHHWRLKPSTIMIFVAGFGIVITACFLERGSVNAWLAMHVFFFIALILMLAGK